MCPILSYQNIATLTPVYRLSKNLLDSLWSNQDLLYNDYRAVIEKKDHVLTGSKE